jgi:3-oxoacyl-[acyl-carrier protein] reductase
MDLGLKGRVAIVAAASKGLGKAVALELAKEGAEVAICARGAEQLEQTAREIEAVSGRKVLAEVVDVREVGAIAGFVGAVVERLGGVDICVTNSGGPPSKVFRDTTVEDWKSATDQLLMSTVAFARETLPRMQKNKWGRLITITSSAVKQPVEGLLLSNALRSAVTGLAKTLANEYAGYGITVNNVCPGYTRTDRLDGLARAISERAGGKPEDVFAKWEQEIPAGRLGTPEEFAAVVAFLASERAGYVNGVSIAVDGGMVRSLL